MSDFWSQVAAISAPIIIGYFVALTHSFQGAFIVAAAFLVIGSAAYACLLGKIETIPGP